MANTHKPSANDKWQTNDDFLSALYGWAEYDLTVDFTAGLNKRIEAKYHFTEEHSCLTHDIPKGTWFKNPPFSTPLPFVQRFMSELYRTKSDGIMLLPSRCLHNKGTGAIINACCDYVVHCSPRLHYLDKNLKLVPNADFDSVIGYTGFSYRRKQLFLENFNKFGFLKYYK